MKKVAIFVSGSGTNMENIAKKVGSGELDCEIVTIVCDNPEALALKRAANLGLSTFVVKRKEFKSKEEFEQKITQHLKEKKVDFIILAGYMKIIGPEFIKTWQGKIINIHPSFLPKYPGAHAIKDAYEAKEKETGVTVHYVIEEVDAGPVILQRSVPIKPDDSLERLEARVHEVEYQIYPEAIKLLLAGKVQFK